MRGRPYPPLPGCVCDAHAYALKIDAAIAIPGNKERKIHLLLLDAFWELKCGEKEMG